MAVQLSTFQRKMYLFSVTCVAIQCIIFVSCDSNTVQNNLNSDTQAKIDYFIRNIYFPSTNVTEGLSLAVVENNGENIFTTGYGKADHENDIPITNNTKIFIGSVTKSVTALVIVKTLSEKFPELGETVLDTPIIKLIPEFKFILNDRFRTEFVSFRDLLAHRVCLVNDGAQLTAAPFMNKSEIVFRQRYSKEQCGLRSEWHYHNQMYIVAGEVIGAIANKSFEELVQDFLNHIGMTNSSFMRDGEIPSFIDVAKPYYIRNNATHPGNVELLRRLLPYNAAGGLMTTANDAAKYMMFHLNLGKVGNNQVIPETTMKWLSKPAIHLPTPSFKKVENDTTLDRFSYGLGLITASYNGWKCVFHAGYFYPYATHMSIYPDLKIGIFTSTNQGPTHFHQTGLHSFIVEVLKGNTTLTDADWSKYKQESANELMEDNLNDAVLKNITQSSNQMNFSNNIIGTYGSGFAGEVEIMEKFNSQTNSTTLYLKYGEWAHAWMSFVGSDIFHLLWDTDIVQDSYALGVTPDFDFATIKNGTLTLASLWAGNFIPYSTFERGVTLSTLPTIPWDTKNCSS